MSEVDMSKSEFEAALKLQGFKLVLYMDTFYQPGKPGYQDKFEIALADGTSTNVRVPPAHLKNRRRTLLALVKMRQEIEKDLTVQCCESSVED